jgi:hypothetical protein
MKNILNLVFLALIALLVLGCGLSKYLDKSGNVEVNKASPTPVVASTTNPTANVSATPRPAQPGIFDTLKKSAGKYPYELKLLENKEMQARLKKLLGKDFADMKLYWNVESPIAIQEGILMTSGCEQHNCGDNIYYLFIDFAKDNINVVHIQDEKTNNYFEKGRISLPRKFADEFGGNQ